MLKERRNPSLCRTLNIEALEDRALLSGNVTAVVNNGLLSIRGVASGDASDHGYSINQTNNLGSPTLTVAGLNNTTINHLGSVDFFLAAITGIVIGEGAGSTVNMGDATGFSVPGTISISVGNGGSNHREVVALNGITAGDIVIAASTDESDYPNGNVNYGFYVTLTHDMVTDAHGGLFMQDSGAGFDSVFLGVTPTGAPNATSFGNPASGDFLTVQGEMLVGLASGNSTFGPANVLETHNTTCGFGIIDGGGADSIYTDGGGNSGFFVTGFIGGGGRH